MSCTLLQYCNKFRVMQIKLVVAHYGDSLTTISGKSLGTLHFIVARLYWCSPPLPTPNIIDECYPSNHATIFQNCFEGKWGGAIKI